MLEQTTTARADQSERAQTKTRRVAFAVGGLYTEASGVARIVSDLARALARSGQPIDVYTAACQGEAARDLIAAPNRLIAEHGQWWGRLSRSPELKRRLEADISNIDVVHNHSVWMLPNHYASSAARRRGRPVLFTAHGVLEPWALARSRWKKRVAGWWFQNRDLRSAACIHVNSEAEIRGVRAYGLAQPVAVIPNGVDIDAFSNLPPRDELVTEFPELRGKKVCLFLSRLHEKKGLAPLLAAWNVVGGEFPEWQLLIAGPDDGFLEAVERMRREFALERSVTLAGPRYGRAKLATLGGADVFVLPSYSEGFSMAVLEALASRLPALITPGCHFDEAVSAGAARLALPDAPTLAERLREMLSLSDAERADMGTRGRALVEARYTWDAVARDTRQVYDWLIDGGAAPETVRWG